MKRFKNMVRKGGVADIVTLMVIVGLVIALIIAVVLPMVNSASRTGGEVKDNVTNTNSFITGLGQGSIQENPIYASKVNI